MFSVIRVYDNGNEKKYGSYSTAHRAFAVWRSVKAECDLYNLYCDKPHMQKLVGNQKSNVYVKDLDNDVLYIDQQDYLNTNPGDKFKPHLEIKYGNNVLLKFGDKQNAS